MAGSCYVSLGLWPGIWVGGERPTVVGAQCMGEPSQAWRRSVREPESLGAGTGRGQALHGGSPAPMPVLPQGHLAFCPSPRACGESTLPNTTLVWPPGQSWLLPWWVGNGQPFHSPMPEAISSKPISGELGGGVEASVTGPQSPSGSWATTTGADNVSAAGTCGFSLGAPVKSCPGSEGPAER